MAKNLKRISILSVIAILILLQLVNIFNFKSSFYDNVFAWDGVTSSMPLGAGTESEPYLISSAEELFYVSVQNNLGNLEADTYYELTNDINLEEYEWTPIGTLENAFRGNFDGNNYAIYNVNIEISNDLNYYGLFGYVLGAKIENLKIAEVEYTYDFTDKLQNVSIGSIVGYATNNAEIVSVITSGAITIQNASNIINLGGVVGYLNNSELTKAYNNTRFVINNTNSLTIGGLVGYANNSNIEDSFNKRDINLVTTSSLILGGIVGNSQNTQFKKVFNNANLQARSESVFIGGIAGLLQEVLTETHSYIYNLGGISLFGTNELNTNLFAGGLFGQVIGNNAVEYTYNIGEVKIDDYSVATTLNIGSLIGELGVGASISSSYYQRENKIGTYGVGTNFGEITAVEDESNANMKSRGTYVGDGWNFNSTWIWSANLNSSYPAIRYVGNYAIHLQISGSGTVKNFSSGVYFYSLGEGVSYTLVSGSGYEIDKIIFGAQEITAFSGDRIATYNAISNGMPSTRELNFLVSFVRVPFTKTQMFWYAVVVGAIIIIMIVGTVIINYRYDVKMDKIIAEKKKTIKIKPETEKSNINKKQIK